MGPNDKRPNQREEETKHAAELRRLLEDFAADVPAYMEKLRRKLNSAQRMTPARRSEATAARAVAADPIHVGPHRATYKTDESGKVDLHGERQQE
jgi:hypothetical protein